MSIPHWWYVTGMIFEKIPTGYILRIRVTPNASKCGFGGIFSTPDNQDFIKINLNAVPEKGKANQELIKFLSKYLHLNKSSFSILSGETDRYKKILIKTAHIETIENLLNDMEQAS